MPQAERLLKAVDGQEGSPEVQPLIVVLAASLGSAGSVRRHLSTLGDRPRGVNSPAGIG